MEVPLQVCGRSGDRTLAGGKGLPAAAGATGDSAGSDASSAAAIERSELRVEERDGRSIVVDASGKATGVLAR